MIEVDMQIIYILQVQIKSLRSPYAIEKGESSLRL